MEKKKYSINWEDDEPVSFEVDGVEYDNIEDIPDEADRLKIEAMVDGSLEQEFDREFKRVFEEASRSKFNPEKIILGVFSAVAVLMFLIAAISSVNVIRRTSREVSAPGRVVEIVMRREYINQQDRIVQEYYFPVIEFTSSDGREHSIQSTEGSSPPSYAVGDQVIVLYDPQNPAEVRIKSFGSSALNWLLPAITGVIGLGFLVAVLAVRRFMDPEKSEEESIIQAAG